MEKARVARSAPASVRTSSISSCCSWFTPIICGHPPRSKPRILRPEIQGPAVSGHWRISSSEAGELLCSFSSSAVDTIVVARSTRADFPSLFSSFHAVYRSPAAAQCCCADICSDQSQEITRQLVTVNCQKLQELTRSGATDFEERASIRGIEKVAVPHKPVSSYSFKLFASHLTIDPRILFPCSLQ